MSVVEGDRGTRNAVFTVALSSPPPNAASAVTVHYATADNDATGVATASVAGGDYVRMLDHTLTFAAGQVVKYVSVAIIGDTSACGTEAVGETFRLLLSNATNAVLSKATGVGTILNDDSQCGIRVGIGDATITEGDTGLRNARLTVTLSEPAPSAFSISIATGRSGDTAAAGSDYVTTARSFAVSKGATSVIVNIPVIGDTIGEPPEFLSVSLTSTLGTVIRATGIVTITDDDGFTGPVVTSYTNPALATPGYGTLTTGPDGAVWFTNMFGNVVGRITPAGQMTIYSNGVSPEPYAIAACSDGNLWYSTFNSFRTIGRITPGGVGLPPVTNPTISSVWLTCGPDGAVWFNNQSTPDRIGRLDLHTNQLTFFDEPGGNSCTDHQIIAGPDGALWNTCQGSDLIERITTSGQFTLYNSGGSDPWGITVGPDGALWYTLMGSNAIARMDPSNGSVTLFHDSRLSSPGGIVTGADGALWFTNTNDNSIGRLTTDGHFSYVTDPSMNHPSELTAGPNRTIWFNNVGNALIGSISLP